MQGFGAILVEEDEPYFHHGWERTVFGIASFCFARVEAGQFRHAIERMDPGHYLTSSYYEHWLSAAETLLVERGLVSLEDLRARGVEPALSIPVATSAHAPARAETATPRFSAGDFVTVRDMHPSGHTRCPRYVRGKRGTVVRFEGMFNLDDATAHGGGRVAEPVYVVRFEALELWGPDTDADHSVLIEMWESYLT